MGYIIYETKKDFDRRGLRKNMVLLVLSIYSLGVSYFSIVICNANYKQEDNVKLNKVTYTIKTKKADIGRAIYICEWCASEWESAYHSGKRFMDEVVPSIHCPVCQKNSAGEKDPINTNCL